MTIFTPESDEEAQDKQVAAMLGVSIDTVAAQRGALKQFDNAVGQKLWPSSEAFALALTSPTMSSIVKGCDVVEVGCGLGAVGIAAALAGAKSVLLTDFQPRSLELAQASADANGVGDIVRTMLLDWTEPPPGLDATGGPPHGYDLVLGADVLYDKELTTSLLDVVAAFLLEPKARDRSRPEPRGLLVDPPARPCRSMLPGACAERGLYWGGEAPMAEATQADTVLINILRG